jgi:hypothetical protein
MVISDEQLAATVIVLQFVNDSDFPVAVADAVNTFPATNPDKLYVHVPEDTVVVPNSEPFL